MSNRETNRKRRETLHESKKKKKTSTAPPEAELVFDTTIRFFGDPSIGNSENIDAFTSTWPFNVDGEANQFIIEGLLPAELLSGSNLPLEASTIEQEQWTSLELFNPNLPVSCLSYSNYPLWSSSRMIFKYQIPQLEGTPTFSNTMLNLRVFKQENWPNLGIDAEVMLIPSDVQSDATWLEKTSGVGWNQDTLLPNPFNGTNYGGHGVAGSSGGGSSIIALDRPQTNYVKTFRINSGLVENDLIQVDVSDLLNNSGYDFTQAGGTEVAFLVRAAYWNGVNPHVGNEPQPVGCGGDDPVYYKITLCGSGTPPVVLVGLKSMFTRTYSLLETNNYYNTNSGRFICSFVFEEILESEITQDMILLSQASINGIEDLILDVAIPVNNLQELCFGNPRCFLNIDMINRFICYWENAGDTECLETCDDFIYLGITPPDTVNGEDCGTLG